MNIFIKYIWFAIAIVGLIINSYSAAAQRTIPEQSSLQAIALFNGCSFGTEAIYAKYTLNGYWNSGISFNDYSTILDSGDKYQYEHISAKGGYMFRIVGTSKRNVNMYGGGGAFIGCELMDPFEKLPFYIETNTNDFRFLYGIYGEVNLEIFLAEKTALTVNISLPINFSSVFDAIHYQTGLGCRILL